MATIPTPYLFVVTVSQIGGNPHLQVPGARMPAVGHAFKLALGNNVIGRAIAPDVTILLPDMAVSRRHAQIEFDGQSTWELLDLASHNGTELNGKKLQAHAAMPLCEGDRIHIAGFELIFTFQPAPVAPTMDRAEHLAEWDD